MQTIKGNIAGSASGTHTTLRATITNGRNGAGRANRTHPQARTTENCVEQVALRTTREIRTNKTHRTRRKHRTNGTIQREIHVIERKIASRAIVTRRKLRTNKTNRTTRAGRANRTHHAKLNKRHRTI